MHIRKYGERNGISLIETANALAPKQDAPISRVILSFFEGIAYTYLGAKPEIVLEQFPTVFMPGSDNGQLRVLLWSILVAGAYDGQPKSSPIRSAASITEILAAFREKTPAFGHDFVGAIAGRSEAEYAYNAGRAFEFLRIYHDTDEATLIFRRALGLTELLRQTALNRKPSAA